MSPSLISIRSRHPRGLRLADVRLARPLWWGACLRPAFQNHDVRSNPPSNPPGGGLDRVILNSRLFVNSKLRQKIFYPMLGFTMGHLDGFYSVGHRIRPNVESEYQYGSSSPPPEWNRHPTQEQNMIEGLFFWFPFFVWTLSGIYFDLTTFSWKGVIFHFFVKLKIIIKIIQRIILNYSTRGSTEPPSVCSRASAHPRVDCIPSIHL